MTQRYRVQLGELDISEEAEELREFLYDIVSTYPTGIDAEFLKQQYKVKYVETGIGNELPPDWLRQLQLAGEFEVKDFGGSTTVYIVQKETIIPAYLEQLEPSTGMETSKANEVVSPATTEPMDPKPIVADDSSKTQILSIAADGSFFYVRHKKHEFENFSRTVADYYTVNFKEAAISADSVQLNGAYGVLDGARDWSRVLVKDLNNEYSIVPCFFVDYGELRSVPRSSLKKLDDSFAVSAISPFSRCCALAQLDSSKRLPHLLTTTCVETTMLKKAEPTVISLKVERHDDIGDYDIVSAVDAAGQPLMAEFFKGLQASPQTVSSKSAPTLPAPVIDLNPNISCREPKDMPNKKEVVHILSATDPDNISIRLAAWYPAPDYLSSALTRDAENSKPPAKDLIMEGKYFAAKLEDSWERVQVMRPSTTTPGGEYWVVYAIDVGNFHLIHRSQLRPLTESVSNFNKVLLAKCKLNGIKPSDSGVWNREIQTAVQDILLAATKSTVEFTPDSTWSEFDSFNAPKLPFAAGKLTIDGNDFAEQLVSMGLAERA